MINTNIILTQSEMLSQKRAASYIFSDAGKFKHFNQGALMNVDLSDLILQQYEGKKNPYSYVYRDLSPLCCQNGNIGYGVFAARDIPEGTPVTFYAGHVYTPEQKMNRKHENHDYVYEFDDSEHNIDGLWQYDVASWQWWVLRGLGHMLNDSIHENATGLDINTCFKEVDMIDKETQQYVKRVVIVTTRDIVQGEELFVSYSLGYWLSRINKSKDDISYSCQTWLHSMKDLVRQLTRRMYKHGRIGIGYGNNEGDEMEKESIISLRPFLGKVRCMDIYPNQEFDNVESEHYDFFFESQVREGAFDLVFEFDHCQDMVCCDWQNIESNQCRLAVYYTKDTASEKWIQLDVSCACCGKNIGHLSFMN